VGVTVFGWFGAVGCADSAGWSNCHWTGGAGRETQAIREKLGISRGDLLEAKADRGRLTYTLKTIVDRIPSSKAARERFFSNCAPKRTPG
jgi:hypothetical protein